MKKIIFFCAVILTISACREKEQPLSPPVAAFTITNNNCKAPCIVSFQNSSTGDELESYEWNFGDGSLTAFTRDAVHTYTKEGDYVVNLTVRNSRAESNTTQQLVKIGKVAPKNCKVKMVSVSEFPTYPPASVATYWDPYSGGSENIYADPYIRVIDDLGTDYSISDVKMNIKNPDLPYQWNDVFLYNEFGLHNYKPITNLGQNHRVRFLDWDSNSSSEIIRDFYFLPMLYYPSDSLPGTINFNFEATGFDGTASNKLKGTVILEWY